VNRHAAAARAPKSRAPSETLNFRPVFSSDSRVHEYAVQYTAQPLRPGPAASLGSALAKAAQSLDGLRARVPVLLDWLPLPPHSRWTADGFWESDGLRLQDGLLHASPGAFRAGPVSACYPAELVTFLIPLVAPLHPRAELFASYTEFSVGLRARLQSANRHDGLRVTGVHIGLPSGFSASPPLHARLASLIDLASRVRLPVLVRNADTPAEVQGLRPYANVLLQGAMLSPPMSPACLRALLEIGGRRWREFRVGGA